MPALPPHGEAATPATTSSDINGDEPLALPLTRLEIRDLSSEGSKRFLSSVDPAQILEAAIKTVHDVLTPGHLSTPGVRSVTLILREFAGVAYTTGKDIDFEHKEIHFNTEYIEGIDAELLTSEITGVVVHEMVHVWQWNGEHSCNGGLIEGVADWVRLKAGLGPPHWRKRCEGCQWDSGYEVTGYFLEWLEEEFGKDIVVRMNQHLRNSYVEEDFWREMCGGQDVKSLWDKYALSLSRKEDPKEKSSLPIIEETEGKKREGAASLIDTV